MELLKIRVRMEDIINKKELFFVCNNKKYFNFNAIIPEPKYPPKDFNMYEWRIKNWGTPMLARSTKIEMDNSVLITSNGNPIKIWKKLSKMYPENIITIIVFQDNIQKSLIKYKNGEEVK